MLSFAFLLSVCALLPLAQAAPVPLFGINFGAGAEANGTPTPVSQSTIDSTLRRPAFFARAAYCSPQSVQTLSCGAPCDVINTIKVLQAGGDEAATPRFFIAQDPDNQSIVVAHQGTDPEELLSDLNDLEVAQVSMNTTLFPSAAQGSLVHDGFQQTQGRTADLVLSTVKSALASTGYTNVLVTGHSLGAAVATLDAIMLRMQLPSNVGVDSVVFGLPRVGNQQFANMIDSMLPSFSHVTNQKDPVPIVPPQDLSFQHPEGELHITSVDSSGNDTTMVACPGQENKNCSDTNSLLDATVDNHLGPYFDDISFGGAACPA
ncbi:uncharacterized protein PHACADRAFT_114705 [Phanerochaete carnosa HHB-10118-sp]|uniref:Fungal lipase-type domain-containing protein n=1 Tax=Phanerochaete carnosa (strain HHB-10118-sp) TaxID=650164 RepID=K5V9W9_PHACS|nr:uncharacterized protein PHACADRAFT_114705 [Phanerochaete carnosa HHB-10118-sp]EKM59656.1 hypothetical protein PHACADRAFT_114705 [Phanerochaete carnosa HHB-10118-sp]